MADDVDQSRAIALLSDPATHGLAASARVERIETHISLIFLAGARAYKLKRARRLPFLDFSTLEARRAACLRELEVNAAAGDLYRRVVAICATGDGGRAGALQPAEAPPRADEILDYAVEMERFDAADEAGARLADGRLTPSDMRALGDVVAAAQAAAPVRVHDHDMRGLIDSIAATLGREGRHSADWRAAARARTEATSALRDARMAAGRVRRLHGDLHLGNVVVRGGRPTPFDAMEFNESMATIDVAYDAAFAAMDCLDKGRPDLAAAFTSRWFARAQDYEALALWPLCLSVRAAVRAMVAALGGDAATAAHRLALAERLATWPDAPRLVLIGGLSGSGKSTVASALAPYLDGGTGAVHIASDVARKTLLGAAPDARLGADGYSAEVTARVLDALEAAARATLAAGRVAIVDMTFARADDRARFADVARDAGTRCDALWLDAGMDARAARATARAEAGGDPSDATADIARAQTADPLEAGWRAVDASGDVAATIADARRALGLS